MIKALGCRADNAHDRTHRTEIERKAPRAGRRAGFVQYARAALTIAVFVGPAPVWSEQTVTNLCKPTVIASDTVATATQRLVAGGKVRPRSLIDPANGFAWPDTPLGVVKSRDGTRYLFFGSDGGCHGHCASVTQRAGSITRTVGDLDDPLGQGAPTETLLQGPELRSPTDYVGGGPVLRAPPGKAGAGALLMVYHAEEATYVDGHQYPDPLKYQASFYSRLGLASSTDDGLTWTDLGFVIEGNRPYEPHAPGYEIGDGDLVLDPSGQFFYLYFPDRIVGGPSDTFMSVARAPEAAVLDAAFGGGPAPVFTKYFQGAWTEPGLGGRSTSVLPRPYPAYAGTARVAFSDALGRYVAILDDTQNISYAESPDGLAWADPVLVKATDPKVASANYAVGVGAGDDPARLGTPFYVYFTRSPNNTGWERTDVRRLTVDCGG